ncbi:MAG: alpha/beta fold hydrolase [Burkholderiaceae bacterium]|nr:alpha/beta fold hydrolase [Roseateles sp.]MBV8469676.1 alpha/beta fold hydrolase [Burkholderiaceae bacterium]
MHSGPRRGTPLALLFTIAALLGAKGALAAPTPKPPTHACRIPGVATELQCGTLKRALDPAHAAGVQIDIHYLVVPARSRNKAGDPVLLLAGGPGQSAIALAPQTMNMLHRLNNRRDLIFIDQRGTGDSAPLDCPDEAEQPLSQRLDEAAQLQTLKTCRDALQKLPYGDLRFFTTAIAMQDMDAVRDHLGIAQWNLLGGSYGTRAALEYLRQFPQHVRRTVIDGVTPPDMVLPQSLSLDAQGQFDAMLAACEREAACQARFPALRHEWAELLGSLPRPVSLSDPLSGKTEHVTLKPAMLLRSVQPALYAPALTAALPAAIHAASQGRFEGLIGLASIVSGGKSGKIATGMHFSVVCAEDAPRMQVQAAGGRDFGPYQSQLYEQVCSFWPRGAVPANFYAIPPARTPVLLLSGGADPVTPPRHAKRVAQALGPLARQQIVPEAGHGVMALPCMAEVLFRFFDAPTDAEALQVDTQCAARIPRPAAFQPVQAASGAASSTTP